MIYRGAPAPWCVIYKYIYIHYIDVFCARWRTHLYSGSGLQKYDPKIVNGLSVFTVRDACFGYTFSRGCAGLFCVTDA